MSKRRPGTVWAWGALGTAGSVLVALAGPRLATRGAHGWWFEPRVSHGFATALLYAGLVVICIAWLGLGSQLHVANGVRLWLIGALWTAPVLLGPALFSRDVYSYLAQSEILHLGLDPYRDAPVVLAQHGQAQLLAAVSPFWRHTTAPYGPLFVALVSPIASLSRSNPIDAVLLVKLLDAAGLVLLGVFVPRLARSLGADPRRAAWLAVLSPLTMLELVAAGHNDALMAGLMAAGLALAIEDRPLAGVGLCAVAATIKLPAAAGIVFIVVAAARGADTRAGRARLVGAAALLTTAVLALISVATGVGAHWLSTGVFSTPQKVRLAITPATGIGYTLASVLHHVGITANARSIESAFGDLAGVLVLVLAAMLLWRVSKPTLVRDLGIVLVAAAVGGPAAWPWYLIWGLALLAACPGPQRARPFPFALTVPVFLIKADGIALPPRPYSPLVVVLYSVLVVLAVIAWQTWRRNGGALPRLARRPAPPRPGPST